MKNNEKLKMRRGLTHDEIDTYLEVNEGKVKKQSRYDEEESIEKLQSRVIDDGSNDEIQRTQDEQDWKHYWHLDVRKRMRTGKRLTCGVSQTDTDS